jgi:16S rRNA (uracil1498-N3)-methyltransferase
VTPPLFWTPAGTLAGGAGTVVELTGPEARHAVTVVRLRPGEAVLLSDAAGSRAWGSVTSAAGGSEPRLEVLVERVERSARRVPELVLVQALAKHRRDEEAVSAAVQLGADRIIPWQADRSEPRWSGTDRAAKGHARWDQVIRREGKVARRALLPDLEDVMGSAALAGRLEREVGGSGAHGIVLHEAADASFAEVAAGAKAASAVFLLVGPEGSITPEEVDAFRAAGARTARLGPEILRTALAGAAALTLASHVLGRWR